MTLEIRPILATLLRNRTAAILVGLQVALTLAVVANALHIVAQRSAAVARPTGIATPELFFVQSYGYAPGYSAAATVSRDLALLRSLPGVVAAASITAVPLSNSGSAGTYAASADPGAPDAPGNYFGVDEHGIETLGLRLVAGRNFRAGEIERGPVTSEMPKVAILSQALATKLFGAAPAVGRRLYVDDGQSAEVVGVYERMMGSWPRATQIDPYQTLLLPGTGDGPTARYAVRARPGERDRLMAEVERRLADADPTRLITWVRAHEGTVERAYRGDRRMIAFLGVLVALMTAVTALGIVGLATFNVTTRRKQIGTRRALGARRADIVRWFAVENGLLSAAGVLAGAACAYALAGWLTTAFQLPPLPPGYVAATAAALLLLGQLAVGWPARRAASIPPAVATRTV